jgi:hypothetical protein
MKLTTSPFGTSRHFAARGNLVAFGVKLTVFEHELVFAPDQRAPRSSSTLLWPAPARVQGGKACAGDEPPDGCQPAAG